MATTKYWTYVVTGSGTFPIDMLRYDQARPKSEEDSSDVEATFRRGAHQEVFQIGIRGQKAPTVERWLSFGWRVGGTEERRD